jgi:hypothetical protein
VPTEPETRRQYRLIDFTFRNADDREQDKCPHKYPVFSSKTPGVFFRRQHNMQQVWENNIKDWQKNIFI